MGEGEGAVNTKVLQRKKKDEQATRVNMLSLISSKHLFGAGAGGGGGATL